MLCNRCQFSSVTREREREREIETPRTQKPRREGGGAGRRGAGRQPAQVFAEQTFRDRASVEIGDCSWSCVVGLGSG